MMMQGMSGLLFDPGAGSVVRLPPSVGEGWWAGAAGAFYDDRDGRFYLTYRYRRPRGVEPDRGGEFLVAESGDGVQFRDVWRLTKDQIGSASIERGCLRRLNDGTWRLWISYVDPEDSRWRIDVLEADAPDRFDVSGRQPVFTAGPLGIEGVKDPWVFAEGPALWMITSFAERAPGAEAAAASDLHHHADAYDTGLILGHSGLAVSVDGRAWQWLGKVLTAGGPGTGWDAYSARIACVMRTGGCYTAYYDGAFGTQNHYDEPTSLAVSFDLQRWTRLSPDRPLLRSPHCSGCCRYFDAIAVGARRFVYYEYGRPDGSHDLRVWTGPSNT